MAKEREKKGAPSSDTQSKEPSTSRRTSPSGEIARRNARARLLRQKNRSRSLKKI